MNRVGSFTYEGAAYFFEHVEDPGDRLLKAVYIVRGPRGASYGLLRTADHADLLFAVNLHGFLHRMPFDGVLFRVEDGKLVADRSLHR